jgi:thioredoxin-related protein
MKLRFPAIVLFVNLLLGVMPLGAAELVMFTLKGCPFCAKWEREIDPIYPRTEEARKAPLRKVDIHQAPAEIADLARKVRYTPTFVLLADGREIGRIEGYSDDATFWGNLGALVKRLEASPAMPASQ